MRRAARVDSNQAECVEEWRKAGLSVLLLHQAGHGCPDTLVGGIVRNSLSSRPENLLVEIKIPGRELKLTEDEETFRLSWKGPLLVTSDPDDVLRFFGLID